MLVLLDAVDWGHVLLYLLGVALGLVEGMPLIRERGGVKTDQEFYLFLFLLAIWPIFAAYWVIVQAVKEYWK